MIINKALYPVSTTLKTINNMQRQMENLQMQLATGKRYNTLADIGQDRVHDINIRSRLGRIEGYQANIQTVETRLSFYNNALERLDEIEADARGFAVPGAYGTNGINLANSKSLATTLMRETIDTLNTDIMGQYIFGGNASDRKPVASFDEIMHGPNGFRSFVQQRHIDDGVDSLGRLTSTVSGAAVTLQEDTADDFGFKIAGGSSSNAAITVALAPVDPLDPDSPQQAVVNCGAQPLPGQDVTIIVNYPDDRTRTEAITLKATNEVPPPAGTFLIGADEAATAANFSTALTDKLSTLADTKLTAASTYRAADQFFTKRGETQHPNAMQWYNGQPLTTSDNPRQTVSTNIDESTKVSYGVTADEHGFVELIKGLAVFAVSDLSLTDPADASQQAGIYDGLVALQRSRLSEVNNAQPGSIEGITMELGLAANTLNTVKSRHTQYNAQLKTMLADIETAPVEEVAMQMMTLRTRLEASYQVTSMVSQLTLVNYLR